MPTGVGIQAIKHPSKMNSSFRGSSDETVIAMQTAYNTRYSDAMERRIAMCKEMAEAKLEQIVNKIMDEPVPVLYNTTGIRVMMPWNIALEKAWLDGYNSIDIDIRDMNEYVVRQRTDSYPFEDKVNIFTGQYIMDQSFIEPLYIKGAPTLRLALGKTLGSQGDEVYPTIRVNEEGVRVLRLTMME